MNNENTLEKIKTLIEDKCGINRTRLVSESRIVEDLKITGTDAIELIVEFGKQFNVNVSNFMAADYFESEGLNSWLFPKEANKKILTIGHLEKAVLAGKLDETVICTASKS
jgi:acyl carrier protein